MKKGNDIIYFGTLAKKKDMFEHTGWDEVIGINGVCPTFTTYIGSSGAYTHIIIKVKNDGQNCKIWNNTPAERDA